VIDDDDVVVVVIYYCDDYLSIGPQRFFVFLNLSTQQ